MSKPHLLLLHGALGTEKQFDTLKEQLSDHFNVHTFNFEGHGGRPSGRPFTIHHFSENVTAYLDKHQLTGVDVFGYSMGGYVALYTALHHPTILGTIITLGTKFNWSEDSAEREVRMLNPGKIEEKVPAFATKLREDHAPGDWKLVMHDTADMMLALGAGMKMEAEDLERIPNRVLIAVGDSDNMVTHEESRDAANTIPDGQLHIMENTRHPIDQVDTVELANLIRKIMA